MHNKDVMVLVTGGTGFIAQYCILALLERGYRVRTTVRNLTRETEVREHLRAGGAEPGDRLSFIAADLGSDSGWAEAAQGCTYVLHGASPTPTGKQASEDDWIRAAVDGNLRVLRAAHEGGVRRVVLTSAFGAICAGHGQMKRPFNESDWSDRQVTMSGLIRSPRLCRNARRGTSLLTKERAWSLQPSTRSRFWGRC